MDPKTIKQIVAPTDFSEPSSHAVDTAMSFARATGATVHVVHVIGDAVYTLPPPVDVAVVAPLDIARVTAETEKTLEAEAERVRAAGVACEVVMLTGRPDKEIVDYAEKLGADVIVMGTHGRSGLAHVLLGSVAERVVKGSTRPVLILPWKDRGKDAKKK